MWPGSAIPKFLSPDQVRRVLAQCDLNSATGMRNYAILLLLSRFGFRADEIVRLTLDSIDWETGRITFAAKTGIGLRCPCQPTWEKRLSSTCNEVAPTRHAASLATRMVNEGSSLPEIAELLRHQSIETTNLYAKVDFHTLGSIALPWPGVRDEPTSPSRRGLFVYAPQSGIQAPMRRRIAFEVRRLRRSSATSESPDHSYLCEGRPRFSGDFGTGLARRCAMNSLHKAVEDYIQMRRSLGFRLREAKVALLNFVSFLDERRAPHITTALGMQWAQQNPAARPAEWARPLSFVRGFARHWSAHDPQTEVPPWGLLPHRPAQARPYLYSDDEAQKLLRAAVTAGSRSARPNVPVAPGAVIGDRLAHPRSAQPAVRRC